MPNQKLMVISGDFHPHALILKDAETSVSLFLLCNKNRPYRHQTHLLRMDEVFEMEVVEAYPGGGIFINSARVHFTIEDVIVAVQLYNEVKRADYSLAIEPGHIRQISYGIGKERHASDPVMQHLDLALMHYREATKLR